MPFLSVLVLREHSQPQAKFELGLSTTFSTHMIITGSCSFFRLNIDYCYDYCFPAPVDEGRVFTKHVFIE